MNTAVLSVRGLCLSAGPAPILDRTDFDLPHGSLTALMGPMGSGKSCLIKFLCGRSDPAITVQWRQAQYLGRPLDQGAHPVLIGQRGRMAGWTDLATDVRRDRLLAEIAAIPSEAVLCIDEPTAGLPEDMAAEVMHALAARTGKAAVLVVTHKVAEVAAHCDHVALMGGGRILVQASAADFFGGRAGREAAHFLRTGGLALPRAGTPAGHLAPDFRPLPETVDASPAPRRPTGPVPVLPGLVLHHLGLAEKAPPPATAFATDRSRVAAIGPASVAVWQPDGGFETVEWPGADRPPDAPLDALIGLCRRIEALLASGHDLTLTPAPNLAGTAALVGALLIARGVAPDRAAEIAAAKLPQLHLGLRLEQLFWDIDLALALD